VAFCFLEEGITTMTTLQAQILVNQIRASHPHLQPAMRIIGNGEVVVRFEQDVYRKKVAFYHLWCIADWQIYVESVLTPRHRRQEAS